MPIPHKSDRKIALAFMTQDDFTDAIHLVETCLPYMDVACVVIGGGYGDTILYWRNWSEVEPKLNVLLSPWEDQFPRQRNKYLRFVEQFIQPGDWLYSSDGDEPPDGHTLQCLHRIADECEDENYNIAGLQCRSESYKGKVKVHESLDSYHKHLFYRWEPGIHYDESKHPHETLILPSGNRMRITPYLYSHRKQENGIWIHGARNLWTGGGGPNLGDSNPRWRELRAIGREHSIHTWHQFHDAMIRGSVPQDMVGWMVKYHDIDGFDGASEHREVYKTYFRIYHPELEPAHLRGKPIP